MSRVHRKQSDIADRLRMSQGTMSKIIKRYREHRHVRPGVSSGCPRKTTAREDRILYGLCRNRRTSSARTLRDQWQQITNVRVSRATVNNRLLRRGLRSRRPAKKPLLTPERRQRRREWAQQLRHRQLRHWRHVLFSDESRFLLHLVDGRVRVRRKGSQWFQDDCLVATRAHGECSVHVWGAIHYGGRSNLVILDGNVNAEAYILLLEAEMLPYAAGHFGRNFLFQHDNASPHRARRTQEFLQQHDVEQLPWPAYSPDLNPIEHCWDALDRAVRSREVQPTNLRELSVALTEEWGRMSQHFMNKLVESVSRRIEAVMRARGGYTRY